MPANIFSTRRNTRNNNKPPSASARGEEVRLSRAAQECLARALLAPPEASPALKRAFARRRQILRGQ